MLTWRKKAILAKIESTYGTDAVPTGAANAILIIASNVTLTPIQADQVERDIVRAGGEKGAFVKQLAGKHVILEYSVEMAGAGAVDTPPPWGVLHRSAGFAETINAATDVVYDPVSSGEESVSEYMHIDGVLHKLLGARSNVGWEFPIKGKPMLRYRTMGLFVAVADAAFPTPVYSAFQQPVLVSKANTPTLTLHGQAVKMSTLTLDAGNVLEHSELVGAEEIRIVDRQASGQITFEAVTLATKDYFSAVTGETLAALQVIHGTVAGNINQIDAPEVQLLNPGYQELQGKAMFTFDLNLPPDAGDDEIKHTTR